MQVEVMIRGHQVPELVRRVDCDRDDMIHSVFARRQLFASPRTDESLSFEHQQLDLIAFPSERSTVVWTAR
jgi:hypothetical protein